MKSPGYAFYLLRKGIRLFLSLGTFPPSLFAATLFPVLAFAGDTQVTRESSTTEGSYTERTGCHIRIGTDEDHGIEATVTLVFPDSGFSVDWGEAERDDNRFSAELDITRHDGPVLPVITEKSHTYPLGKLDDGAYLFEVYLSTGELLETKPFPIVDGEPGSPPVPAHVKLETRQSDGIVDLLATVRFHEPGFRITDWGKPAWHGNAATIAVEAVKETDASERIDKTRHRYRLGELDEGDYHVAFYLNGFPMARHTFEVRDEPWPGMVRFHADSITEPGTGAHQLRVGYRHPDNIDTDSFGDRDLRVLGPDGFDRHPRFVAWEPIMDRMWPPGVVAIYEIDPPGRYWTRDNNGRYAVVLGDRAVRTEAGDYFPAQRLGDFAVKLDPEPQPPVRFVSLEVFPDEASSDPVRYRAKLTVELASSDVEIVSWGHPEHHNELFSVDLEVEWGEAGLPVVREESHEYDLGALRPGDYVFAVYAHAHRIGRERFVIPGDDIPQAELRTEDITEASPHPHPFLVRYRSVDPMDPGSIREAALRIAGPDGYRAEVLPESVEIYHDDHHSFTQALYSAPAPRGGWQAHTNGFYRIGVPPHSIHDQAGRFVPGGAIGGFAVRIEDEPPPPEHPSIDFSLRAEDGVAHVDLRFLPGDSGWRIEEWADRPLVRGSDFIVRVQIDEDAENTDSQANSYRLGQLLPGYYTFHLKGSNGFVSRHPFRIGDDPPVRPFKAWRTAAGEIHGIAEDDRASRFTLREYAFGLDPGDGTILYAERSRDENGHFRLTVTYPEIGSAADLDYRVDISSDLDEWVDATGLVETVRSVAKEDGRIWRTVELTEAAAAVDARFLRVRAVARGD